MKTHLDLPARRGPVRLEGTVALRDRQQEPAVTRAFSALLELHARGSLDGAPSHGKIRWLEACTGSSVAPLELTLDRVPAGFWRLLCGMLEGRGVQAVALRDAGLSPTVAREADRSVEVLAERLGRPAEGQRFEFSIDPNPNFTADRYVHLQFADVLDDKRINSIAARLDAWHETLWGGFCTGLDRFVPQFDSVYPLDPYTVVSHLNPWLSDDDGWRLLLRVVRDIDAGCAPLVSVRIE